MRSSKTDLVKYGLFINRALQKGDTAALFAHLADYMNHYGLKADRADLTQIPTSLSPLHQSTVRHHLRVVK